MLDIIFMTNMQYSLYTDWLYGGRVPRNKGNLFSTRQSLDHDTHMLLLAQDSTVLVAILLSCDDLCIVVDPGLQHNLIVTPPWSKCSTVNTPWKNGCPSSAPQIKTATNMIH
jgi:hypothetical protein